MRIEYFIVMVLAVCLIACGGGEDKSEVIVNNQCFNRDTTIDINCDGVIDNGEQCKKCDADYQECFTNPEDNGLIDDSQCLDIYELCLKSNECE